MNGRPWNTQDGQFIEMWNDRDITMEQMMETLGRTRTAITSRAYFWREAGMLMIDRAESPMQEYVRPKFEPFSMPDNMRYQDDPRAIGPGRPVYVPIRTDHYQSAGSSLGQGGRYRSLSGKHGAV